MTLSQFGFPNNKCDKYIKALDAAGLIEKSAEPDESCTMRTNYRPKNAYLELWYRYIFPNQTARAVGLLEQTLSAGLDVNDN